MKNEMTTMKMAKGALKVSDIGSTEIDDLRKFFDGYVPISAFLMFKGILIRSKSDNLQAFSTQEWSTEFRNMAVELYDKSDAPAFKKSTNGLSVYNIEFLETWYKDVGKRLYTKATNFDFL